MPDPGPLAVLMSRIAAETAAGVSPVRYSHRGMDGQAAYYCWRHMAHCGEVCTACAPPEEAQGRLDLGETSD
ncbi:MAG: hypothetical protein KA745_00105 [Gemmatimonadales bacterium]|nr:hypothetical protein [Gemmatimonadales bacterium]